MNNLVEYLIRCDEAYYNTSNPIVSDATYDALVETLRRIDPTNEYLRKVGAKVKSDKIGRLIPMGTLSKYHKEDEIVKWMDSEGDDAFILSPKYDGFAVELTYRYGALVSASTRGDGYVGEDVFAAVMRVQSVPITISNNDIPELIVRGEAIIPTKYHDKIKELGYSAMRNAVPGIVRSNRVDALGYVDFVAYEFIDGDDNRCSQRNRYSEFIIEDYKIFERDDMKGILARREELRTNSYEYELDGVVLKTIKIKEDDLLNPTHMVAWKYKSNRETTFIRGIDYSMGVSGYFTPIGIFDEVEFQGAKLTRASLGNITRMQNEFADMTLNSVIEVSRRGDIIPYIEKLVYVDDKSEVISYPDTCPYCGQLLAWDDLEPHCINKTCPEKLRLQISQYVRAIGIKGIGDKLVTSLIEAGYIKSIIDVYKLNPDIILTVPRQGQSAVDKWQSLREKKLSALELLTAYPFLDLGKKIWDTILNRFSYQQILSISESDLLDANLKGIGESKINSIITQIRENEEELFWLGKFHHII